MTHDGCWRLAPAYDFTFTVDTSAPAYINRHSLSINGSIEEVTKTDLLAVATRFDIKEANAASHYRTFALEASVTEPWIARIEAEIAARLSLL